MRYRIYCWHPPGYQYQGAGEFRDGIVERNSIIEGVPYPVPEEHIQSYLAHMRLKWPKWVFWPIPVDVPDSTTKESEHG